MARVYLECGCGHRFFVDGAGLAPGKKVPCPACDEPVASPGAAPAPARPAPPAAAAPAVTSPALRLLSSRKLRLFAGIGAGVLLAGIAGIYFATRPPEVDPLREAELQLEARKKAYEKLLAESERSAPTAAAPRPASPAPAPAAPAARPGPAAAPSAALASPAAPGAAPSRTPSADRELSSELAARFRAEVLALPGYYSGYLMSPVERENAERAAASGRGPAAVVELMEGILAGGKLKAVRDERDRIAGLALASERDSAANLPVDRITLEEGRTLDCRIFEETGEFLRISRVLPTGLGGQMQFDRARISKIERGKGAGTEFSRRWEAGRNGPAGPLVELMAWSREHSLGAATKMVACAILRADPSHPQARVEAGLPLDPVEKGTDAPRGGQMAYQGRLWTAAELRDKLQKDGFVLFNGAWYAKKEKVVSFPGLFKVDHGPAPVEFAGTAVLCHEFEVSYHMATDSVSGAMLDQAERKELRRFYAPSVPVRTAGLLPPGVVLPPRTPENDLRIEIEDGVLPEGTPVRGELVFTVPVGALMLEASLMMSAEVKPGGSITVYLLGNTNGEPTRTRLYACDGHDTQLHVLPAELVRGLNDLNLAVVMEMPAAYVLKIEKHRLKSPVYRGRFLTAPGLEVLHVRQVPEYKSILFPSISSTGDVLRLHVSTGEAMPSLDRLFLGNPDALK